MGKGSHDPKADEPSKLAGRTLTMKRSASRDLLGDALDCAASCIDAAALDAYRLDYASSAFGVPLSGHFFTLRSRRRHAINASSRAAGHRDAAVASYACCRAHRFTETPESAPPANRRKKNAGIDWERCAARRESSRRPTTTRPP